VLAPQAQVNDGWFELVLVPVEDRDKLATYVKNKLKDIDEPFSFNVIRAKSISLQWSGAYIHLDDELVKLKKDAEVKVSMQPGLLEFLA
jgi:diacylglycerol kinase family enzyme